MIPSLMPRFDAPQRADAGLAPASGWPEQDRAAMIFCSANLHRPGEFCMLRERRMVKASGPPRPGASPSAQPPTASLIGVAASIAHGAASREKRVSYAIG